MKPTLFVFLLIVGLCALSLHSSPQSSSITTQTVVSQPEVQDKAEHTSQDQRPAQTPHKQDQKSDQIVLSLRSKKDLDRILDQSSSSKSDREDTTSQNDDRGQDQNPSLSTDIVVGDQAEDQDEEQLVFSADREGIKAAISELSGDLHECYDGWIQSNPALKGKIVVSFVIAPPSLDGADDQPAHQSTIQDAQLLVDDVAHPMLSGCVLNSIEGMNFEEVSEPINVNYPFNFKSYE